MDTQERREPFDRSVGEVVSDLFSDASSLFRQEMELARAEMRENLTTMLRDSVGIAIGAALALVGLLALVAAAILALSLVLPAWAAALIVGGVLLLVGAVLAMINLRAMRETGITPKRTIESLRKDARMMKEKLA